MNKSLRILIACFLGATLGALLALHFNHYFWWLGILIGAFTGYLAYDFKEVGRAVAVAWKKARAEISQLKLPSRLKLKEALSWVVAVTIVIIGFIILTVVIGFSWIILFKTMGMAGKNEPQSWVPLFGSCMICGLASEIIAVVMSLPNDKNETVWQYLRTFLLINPVVLSFKIVRYLVRLGRAIPDRILSRFVAHVFRIIHSDIRLLCMMDASLGALIGFKYGNPLIGGVAGAVLGILNYWFVSVRWLKLVPVQSN
jgi:MFS family permease